MGIIAEFKSKMEKKNEIQMQVSKWKFKDG